MKKILIFYGSYGGGHLAAAKSIKKYLEENYPDIQLEMMDCIEYINKFLNKVSTGAYKQMAKNAPWMWELVYNQSKDGPLAKITNTSNKLMSKKLNSLLQEFNPDLIISTHPFGNQMCAILKKNGQLNCKIATTLTDYKLHNQWLYLSEYIDFFFVSNSNMKREMRLTGIPENKIFVTGIPVSNRFLENFDKEETCKEFSLSADKHTVLLFAGGEYGLGRDTTYMTLKALIRLFKDVQVVAIAGKNPKMQKKFSDLIESTNSSDRIKLLSFTDKVPELMNLADIIITKPGGLTITESLVSKLPIIIINPIPGQEEENAEFLTQKGAAVWIKKDDNIARKLKNLSRNPDIVKEMSEKSEELSKPYSTKDICEILLKNI